MRLVLLFAVCILLSSCGSDTTGTIKNESLSNAEKAYADNPDSATANGYMEELMKAMSENKESSNIVALSEKGLEVAVATKIPPRERIFLFNLIKEDYKNEKTSERIMKLADHMEKVKRPQTSNILYKAILENFPNAPEAATASQKLDPGVTNLDNYLINIGEEIFKGELNRIGINRNAALAYVDACEAFALGFPFEAKTPSYLFRAAEIAKSIQTYPKLMSLYDWIIEKYPNYDKAPTTLFLKGFVMENDLQQDAEAQKIYEQFLHTYPNHELVDDVKFLIDNIGKTDEEIRQMIEEKQQKLKEQKEAADS